MYIGAGIGLIAIGLILAMFVNSTLGILFVILGAVAIAVAIAASFFVVGGVARRETVIERERPVRREVIRERGI